MGIPYALQASILVMLVVHTGWHTVASQCIREEDLSEASGCCRQQPFLPDDVIQNCLKNTNEKGNVVSEKQLVCVLSCAYDAMGFINEAGEVNPEKYISSLAPQDDSMREVVTNAANSCAKISADIKRDIEKAQSTCNLYPVMYQMCVSQLTITNCPAKHWTQSSVCEQVKAREPLC